MSYRHGTINGYTTHQCRCDRCRAEGTAYKRRSRRRRRTGAIPAWWHGTATGYNEWSCRCAACTDAARIARRREPREEEIA